MAKKFGKLVLFSALAGAAAAGTYYYLQKKQENPFKIIDDIDDYDYFDDDFDEDFDDIPEMPHGKNRSYVSLDLDNAKEFISEKVIETIDKTKEKIVQFNVAEKLDKAKEFVEEMTSSSESVVSNTSDVIITPSDSTSNNISSTYLDDENADETEESSTEQDPVSGDVKVSIIGSNSHTYTGKSVEPEIEVYDGNIKLELNEDYTVAYKNNKNVSSNVKYKEGGIAAKANMVKQYNDKNVK